MWLEYRRIYNFLNRDLYDWNIEKGEEVYVKFNCNAETPVVYDLTNGTRTVPLYEGAFAEILLPAGQGDRRMIFTDAATVEPISVALTPHQFTDYSAMDAEMVILTHPHFLNAPGNPVEQYANFRSSKYEVATVNVIELYEQFGYGVQHTPLAIRNFAHWIKKTWTDPKYFFIIGKGREYDELRRDNQLALVEGTFYVPTFGWPGSDNLLLSDNESPVPIFAVGRLPITEPEQLQVYLDKVVGFESSENLPHGYDEQGWRKRIIHLGGGTTPSEQNSIRGGLTNMENVIEQSRFAGEVLSFYKNDQNAVSSSQSTEVINEINKGVSLITFFGHSAPGLFDFDIDNPSLYSNKDKYPVMFSLGCYSGNIFSASVGAGERFVTYEEKGAIMFGATRGFGFVSALSDFGVRLNRNLGEEFYGEPVAESVRRTVEYFSDFQNIGMEVLVEQYVLAGDPTITLPVYDGPDLIIDPASGSFEPTLIPSGLDTFTFKIDLLNLGERMSAMDSVSVKLERQLPGGSRDSLGTYRVAIDQFRNPWSVRVPVEGRRATGLNRLFVTVDPTEQVEEKPQPVAENNNRLVNAQGEEGITFSVRGSSARPSYPLNYAIVNQPELSLSAVSSDLIMAETEFVWQLDKTSSFNSPTRLEHRATYGGGVLTWEPAITLEAGQVYFWRIAPVAAAGEETIWQSASFIYLPDSPGGWNQSTGEQLVENSTVLMELDSIDNELSLAWTIQDFKLKNKYYETDDRPNGFINGSKKGEFFPWDIYQSMAFVVMKERGEFLYNYQQPGGGGLYGSTMNSYDRAAVFIYAVDTQQGRADAIDFLENVVPEGARVIAYTALRATTYDLNVDEWAADSLDLNGKNLFNVLEANGAQRIRELESGMRPWTFGYTKGGEVFEEYVVTEAGTETVWQRDLPSVAHQGSFSTRLIGPVASYNEITWLIEGFEAGDNIEGDSVLTTVYGITPAGTEVPLYQNTELEFTQDLSQLSATEYPYLRIRHFTHDLFERTNPEVDYLRVTYEPLPDLAFDPAAEYFVTGDTLMQGQTLKMSTAVRNLIPETSTGEVLLKVIARGENGDEYFLDEMVGGFSADTLGEVSFEIPTDNMTGNQQLLVQINPGLVEREVTDLNNNYQFNFVVQEDVLNPTLEVTFDGVRIMPGDLVSPESEILVRIEDENEFRLLTDSTMFDLSITDPEGTVTVYTADHPRIQYQPATSGADNQASIRLMGEFLTDGTYRLTVQGRDDSGNLSGSQLYDTEFEVVQATTVSNVVNYPNPFTTSTRFVYTLTGSDTDMDYRVRIFSASGRIVRELGPADLGPLRIGTHQTDLAWDGTDMFGDKLAKGTYFYRFDMQDREGNSVEQRENLVLDKFFEQGFGKLVIL